MTLPLILASASRPRRDLLFNAGICPEVRVSEVDEEAAVRGLAADLGLPVAEIPIEQRVLFLSGCKARAIAQMYGRVAECVGRASGEQLVVNPLAGDPEARPAGSAQSIESVLQGDSGMTGLAQGPFILGADSMFEFDGVAYGKPHDVDTARERLSRMRGQRGVLWTGHTLIDLATGKQEHAVSTAQVSFADYSDEEIDRYLATGEPLEVAGSFTLEGFGGAFIESVVGDPHGVIGLSLPLVRSLFQRFSVSWPDLWNVSREDRQVPNPDNPQAPKDNVHQPGDGWVDCACGRRHWGLNGASGILLARRDQAGRVSHVVLQHRAAWSAEGGTWGTPGGATADGESALEGALRESFEEANFTPEDIDIVGSYREDHGPWSYTTVFAFERPGREVFPRANDDESSAVGWVPVEDVSHLPLLQAFGADWPNFLNRFQELAARQRQ